MAMIQTLQSRLTNYEKRETLEEVARMWKTGISGDATSGPTSEYTGSPWVYSCINAIARNVAGVPLRFTEGVEREKDLDKDHWISKLFRRPNMLMSGSELVTATEIFLQLGGNALWVPVPGKVEKGQLTVEELYVFGKKSIKPIVKKNLMVGWEVKWGGEIEKFDIAEVLHFRYFNPEDPIMGIGPLQAAQGAFIQDWWSNKYNEAFFKNFAEPGVVITFPGDYNDKIMKSSRESWDQRHQGFSKMKKTAVLWGGATLTELGASKRDMQYVEGKKWGREETCAVFRVPPVEIMNVDRVSSTVESQKAQRILFGEEVISPELKMLEDRLTIFLQMFRVQNVEAWYDTSEVSILQESMGAKIAQAKDLLGLTLPLNAILKRLDLGFKPVPWGDVAWVPNTLVALGTVVDEDNPDDEEVKPKSKPKAKAKDEEEGLKTAPPKMTGKLKKVLFGLRNEILNYKDGLSQPKWNRAEVRLRNVVAQPDLLIAKIKSWSESASKEEIKLAFNALSHGASTLMPTLALTGSTARASKLPKDYKKLILKYEDKLERRLRSYYRRLGDNYVSAFLTQNKEASVLKFNWQEADDELVTITEDVLISALLSFGKCSTLV